MQNRRAPFLQENEPSFPELGHHHPFFSHLSSRERGEWAVSPGLSVPRPLLPSAFSRHSKADGTGDLQQGKLRQGLGRSPVAWADCDTNLCASECLAPPEVEAKGLERLSRGFGRSQHHWQPAAAGGELLGQRRRWGAVAMDPPAQGHSTGHSELRDGPNHPGCHQQPQEQHCHQQPQESSCLEPALLASPSPNMKFLRGIPMLPTNPGTGDAQSGCSGSRPSAGTCSATQTAKSSLSPLEASSSRFSNGRCNFQPKFICGHFLYHSFLLPALAFG